jgi:hypothetical protein
MKQVHRLSGLLGLLGLLALTGCGGGGGSVTTSSTSTQDNFSGGGNNVVTMEVEPGPAPSGYQPFNQPLVSVRICNPSTNTCGTITDVLVDTGSFGLRLMASAMSSAGVTLPALPDPNAPATNTIQECLPFADGYAWGQVSLADVSVGGETTTGSIAIQVINDSNSPTPAPPSGCTNGSSLDSVTDLGANGILGVGVFAQDCGTACTQPNNYDLYFTCVTTTGSCSSTAETLADQVTNPTVDFPTDNNGVILQLPAISSSGAQTDTGYLVFGIGTESNNALGSATVLTANDEGNFTTQFNGSSLTSSFIDSGSNALFFNDSSLALCGSSGAAAEFYCPAATADLTATNEGESGTTSDVSFSIANLNDISGANFAIDDTGGPAPTISGFGPYFDWGLPFFYGRTIFFAVEGASAGGATGPYYAY